MLCQRGVYMENIARPIIRGMVFCVEVHATENGKFRADFGAQPTEGNHRSKCPVTQSRIGQAARFVSAGGCPDVHDATQLEITVGPTSHDGHYLHVPEAKGRLAFGASELYASPAESGSGLNIRPDNRKADS